MFTCFYRVIKEFSCNICNIYRLQGNLIVGNYRIFPADFAEIPLNHLPVNPCKHLQCTVVCDYGVKDKGT